MKNLFKKSNKKVVVKARTIDKKQMEKVTGGLALPGPSKEEIEAREK